MYVQEYIWKYSKNDKLESILEVKGTYMNSLFYQ